MNIQYPTEQGKNGESRGHSDERVGAPEFRIYAEAKASFSEHVGRESVPPRLPRQKKNRSKMLRPHPRPRSVRTWDFDKRQRDPQYRPHSSTSSAISLTRRMSPSGGT